MTKKTKKLSLNKETVRHLSNASLARAAGGGIIIIRKTLNFAETCVGCYLVPNTDNGALGDAVSLAAIGCSDVPTKTMLLC